jgi:polysaccharide biosynthesis transport protein
LTVISQDPARPSQGLQTYQRPADFAARAEPMPGLDLRDVLSFLGRHWMTLGFAVVIGAGLGIAAVDVLPHRYRAEGLLTIDTRELNIPEFQSIRSSRSSRTTESWGGRSEARVLESREMVATVAERLDLQRDPRFNPTIEGPALFQWLRGLSWLPESWRDSLMPVPEFSPGANAKVVQQMTRALTVSSEERSYVINVRYVSDDPILSARIVNDLMDGYLEQDIRAKRRTVDQARARLKDRLDDLRRDLESTWTRIRTLEGQDGALQTNQGTVRVQEVVALKLERIRLLSDLAKVQIDFGQISAGLARNRISITNEKLITPRLAALWENEAKLQQPLGEMGYSAPSIYPRVQQAQAGLQRLRQEVRDEVTAIRDGLRQRVAELEARDDSLQRQLVQLETNASSTAAGRALLDQLRTDAASKQTLYDQYRNRYEQTIANAELVTADARIVSYAVPPIKPTYPSATARAAIGALAGLCICVALLVSRRWLRNRIETLDEAERIAGVTALGGIPRVTRWARQTDVTNLVLEQPASALAATVRGILYQIAFSHMARPMQAVMVTSPLSHDGKSSLVVSMARVGARDGLRCLAIECDFYRPTLAQKISVRPKHFLNDTGTGEPILSDMITEDPASGAHFVLAKASVDTADSLPSQVQHLRRLIQEARGHYDLILIDTPPLQSVVDPLLLSQMADGMILLLPWGKMSYPRTRNAIQRLAKFACPLIGVVLARVPNRPGLDYAYSGYINEKA